MCGCIRTLGVSIWPAVSIYAIYHLLKTRDAKEYELMNIVHINLFIAWVKLVQNVMMFCQESE